MTNAAGGHSAATLYETAFRETRASPVAGAGRPDWGLSIANRS